MAPNVNESLSEKRRRAGKLGAAARWGHATVNGKVPAGAIGNGKSGWYRIENKASAVAEVYLYDEVGGWGVTAAEFADELKSLSATTINMFINSPGGELFDGLAILNALRRHAATVHVTVDGLAASAASFIAMAGDTITMSRNSQMMIHDGMGLAIGNAAELRDYSELLDRQSDNIAAIYAEAAGKRNGSGDATEWRGLMRAETWFTAEEAVAAGLADRVEGESADDDIENRFSSMLSNFKFRGRDHAPAPAAKAATDVEFDLDSLTEALEGAFSR